MEAVDDRALVAEITTRFAALTALVPLHAITCEEDHDAALRMLDKLLDAGAADEGHPLADLANALGNVIVQYEEVHYPLGPISPADMLRTLMEENDLTPSEMPEIGSPDIVTEILSGERELSVQQIRAVAERFNVPPSIFL